MAPCYPNTLLRLASATSRLTSHWSPTPGPKLQPSYELAYAPNVMGPQAHVFKITIHTDRSAFPSSSQRDSCLTRLSLATISLGNHFLVSSSPLPPQHLSGALFLCSHSILGTPQSHHLSPRLFPQFVWEFLEGKDYVFLPAVSVYQTECLTHRG